MAPGHRNCLLVIVAVRFCTPICNEPSSPVERIIKPSDESVPRPKERSAGTIATWNAETYNLHSQPCGCKISSRWGAITTQDKMWGLQTAGRRDLSYQHISEVSFFCTLHDIAQLETIREPKALPLSPPEFRMLAGAMHIEKAGIPTMTELIAAQLAD